MYMYDLIPTFREHFNSFHFIREEQSDTDLIDFDGI